MLSKFFIFLGVFLLLIASYLCWERQNPKRLSFVYNINTKTIEGKFHFPVEISIPAKRIDLGIYKAKIVNNSWETTSEGVSYLVTSPIPGEKGNSILYGHNWNSLLGSLVRVKPGEEIVIRFNDNSKKTFTVTSTAVVNPDQVNVLAQTKDKRLTIYTCTGFLDSKRFVASAIATL